MCVPSQAGIKHIGVNHLTGFENAMSINPQACPTETRRHLRSFAERTHWGSNSCLAHGNGRWLVKVPFTRYKSARTSTRPSSPQVEMGRNRMAIWERPGCARSLVTWPPVNGRQPSIQGGCTSDWSARAGQAGRRRAWFGPPCARVLRFLSFPVYSSVQMPVAGWKHHRPSANQITTYYELKELTRQKLN